jgi:hypothetical protein
MRGLCSRGGESEPHISSSMSISCCCTFLHHLPAIACYHLTMCVIMPTTSYKHHPPTHTHLVRTVGHQPEHCISRLPLKDPTWPEPSFPQTQPSRCGPQPLETPTWLEAEAWPEL